jgi:hydroxymethylbilane synthase
VAEGRFDAIVLARAGLARLGRLDAAYEVLPTEVILPAVGQGALAIFARGKDSAILSLLEVLDHGASHREAEAERSLLATLEAGCKAPVAGLARGGDGSIRVAAAVFSPDGGRALREDASGPAGEAASVGRTTGEKLLARGAADLIREAGS